MLLEIDIEYIIDQLINLGMEIDRDEHDNIKAKITIGDKTIRYELAWSQFRSVQALFIDSEWIYLYKTKLNMAFAFNFSLICYEIKYQIDILRDQFIELRKKDE